MNDGENNEGTVVGANVNLQGTISDNNDIIIHGTVEGEVISDKNINITPSAVVKGPIRGSIVTVGGSIEGDVEGKEKTEILPTGKVNGSISTTELIIQSGAIFNGTCSMTSENQRAKIEETSEERKQKSEEKPKIEQKPKKNLKNEESDEDVAEADDILDDFELD